MRANRHILTILVLFCSLPPVKAQLGFELDIEKPKPYENRELKAEKSGQKKFTANRRFFQNLTTHYNYFFNASNRINEVISRAKLAHKEDYGTLLPFYNYKLDQTAQEKSELDSVIYKAKTGIVMHDLRNDWADDLYLLWGASYFLQQQYDSAYQMFQFINTAFAEKEKDGYYKFIGSRIDGNSAGSIATKEEQKGLKGMISDPPSRNNAFIWQIRTLIESNLFVQAGTLIATLRNDPNFPERLDPSLSEVQAYWFYRQQRWDSAAVHLENAFSRAANKQEKARWEFLAAQLYDRSGRPEKATDLYNRAISHTTDPVLDVYARLNLIRINKEGGDNYIDKNIAELVQMARRDKYQDYRHVIYFMLAQMEKERNNFAAAQAYLLKGIRYTGNDPQSRNTSFLNLADLAFQNRDYRVSASFYDSLELNGIPPADLQRVEERKALLQQLVPHIQMVSVQDSLQAVARMPEGERNTYIRKLVRQLRREQGLKDEDAIAVVPVNTAPPADLFAGTQNKGEWYFYNPNSRTQGAATFRQVWGNRPNTDNWRRMSDVTAQMNKPVPGSNFGTPGENGESDGGATPTFTSLMATLPLTDEQVATSNEQIRTALFTLGNVYLNEAQDYVSAARTYEELLRRFPEAPRKEETLFSLYYAYTKTGELDKAAEIKKRLVTEHPGTRSAAIVSTGKDPFAPAPQTEVTRAYEGVYNLFIEGKFDQAKRAKQSADSLYNTSTWSPQLLYIEAVYHLQLREDSTATNILQTLINQNGGSPLAEKATRLVEVIGRRKEIEEELRNLKLERPAEDTVQRAVVIATPVTPKAEPEPKETVVTPPVQKETAATPPPVQKETAVVPKEQPKQQPPVVATTPPVVRKDTAAAQPVAPPTSVRRDTTALVVAPTPQRTTNSPAVDTTARRTALPKTVPGSLYSVNPDAAHTAVVVLKKVDPVFVNETRNAFNRYNGEKYYNQRLTIDVVKLSDDTQLLVIGNFAGIIYASDYVQKVQQVAATEIIPWLKGDKYSFSLISAPNLEVLKANPDLDKYLKFLEQNMKVKF